MACLWLKSRRLEELNGNSWVENVQGAKLT